MWQQPIVCALVGGAPYKEDCITLIQGGWINSKLIHVSQNLILECKMK